MDYPANFGPVEVQLKNGDRITIYVPGSSEWENKRSAERLYGIPGIFLKEARAVFYEKYGKPGTFVMESKPEVPYDLYYGTIDDNSKFSTQSIRDVFRYDNSRPLRDAFKPIQYNFASFMDYIRAFYPYNGKFLEELINISDPLKIIMKIIDCLNLIVIGDFNDAIDCYREFGHKFYYTFSYARYAERNQIYAELQIAYSVLRVIYNLPFLDYRYFPVEIHKTHLYDGIDRQEYINNLKLEIESIFDPIKEPGSN